MGFGVIRPHAITMAAASDSMSVNVQQAFAKVYLQIPTMTSNSAIDVYASIDGTNYFQVRGMVPTPITVFTKTMASADSVVSAFNFGRFFAKVYLQVGSMNSSANLDVLGSFDGTNFYQIRSVSPTTQAVQSTFTIAASATANGCLIQIPAGVQHIKLIADSAPSIAVGFKAVGHDEVGQIATFTIGASAAANGGIHPIPGGFQYYKFIATDSAPTAATTFRVVCGDN